MIPRAGMMLDIERKQNILLQKAHITLAQEGKSLHRAVRHRFDSGSRFRQ